MLQKQGIKVYAIGTSTKKAYEVILENLTMPVLALWSVFVLVTALHVPLPKAISAYLIDVCWLKYAGVGICYAGLIIFLWALISFGKAWRIGIDEQNADELITGGIFRYSRNPIFLFMDAYFVGVALIYPNIVLVVVALGMIAGIHLQIVREEKFLERKFGDRYRAYKRQTRRYV
jgi:protein-S-isoprenylcysteine O-methyltransferase Ste14